jgi:predicted RNA-binding protein YlqC (UPF0109 family)
MRELLEFIVKSLVDDPLQVEITEIQRDRGIILRLRVAPEDMGRIIGKNGRVVNSIRALLRVAAARDGRRVDLEVD